MGPDHRPALLPKATRQLVRILQLFGVGFVGGLEEVGTGVGLLRVHIDQYRFLAKAEGHSLWVGHDLVKDLFCGFVGGLHHRLLNRYWLAARVTGRHVPLNER